MIDNQMDIMVVMFIFHVDTILENSSFSKDVLFPSLPIPQIRNGFSSPAWKDGAFKPGFL
jgi:hypothetical protein